MTAIPESRLAEIEARCFAMGMSVAEKAELCRGYRASRDSADEMSGVAYKVRFFGIDPLNIGAGATHPILPESWRFAFTKDLDGVLRFAFNDSGPLVLAAATDTLTAERDAFKETVHDEIAANLAFREAGGALPDEDMPTFCARLIAERDTLALKLETTQKRYEYEAQDVHRWCGRAIKAEAERDALRAAVLLARNTFEGYAAIHREKQTPDGYSKATFNSELAARMNCALLTGNTGEQG